MKSTGISLNDKKQSIVEKESDEIKNSEKVEKKLLYNVLLEKFDATAKAKIIREVKIILPKLNLVEVDGFFSYFFRPRHWSKVLQRCSLRVSKRKMRIKSRLR